LRESGAKLRHSEAVATEETGEEIVIPGFRLKKLGTATISDTSVHIHKKVAVPTNRTVYFQSDWEDIVVTAPMLTVESVPVKQPKGYKGYVFQLELTGLATGPTLLTVRPGPKAAAAIKGPKPCSMLNVTILPEIVLQDPNSDEGLMARILLHEVRTPAYGDYVLEEASKAMNWVRNVLDNRRFRRFDLCMFKTQPSLLDVVQKHATYKDKHGKEQIPIRGIGHLPECFGSRDEERERLRSARQRRFRPQTKPVRRPRECRA
jgi:hypothetical protein